MPFLGDAMLKDVLFSALAVIVVVVSGRRRRAQGADGPARPDAGRRQPPAGMAVPWLFALLSLSPPAAETFIILVFPVDADRRPVPGAVRVQPRRASAQPPAGGRAVGGRDLHACSAC